MLKLIKDNDARRIVGGTTCSNKVSCMYHHAPPHTGAGPGYNLSPSGRNIPGLSGSRE